ncbi:hypothetical protein OS190_07075 [Sulfitobacter sp. F26204]|uniref:hypothetical protein n=1 Tax=Sulfitobacter sp. F26204 TaxID=2996014 RepID=UPI00225E6A25|nr:hypothetical protein [Sulfitobacter sp. F26204]MCX7559328.1 hypothetical protein [Sulfitobacter sp. F26204]
MKAVRRPLFWYNLVMWLVSVVFASLLIQLGSLIMSDVPTAGKRISREDFLDQQQMDVVDARIDQAQSRLQQLEDEFEDARFVLESRTLDYQNQRASFENWIKTRSATQSESQNAEVVDRVRAVELLKLEERTAQRRVNGLGQDIVQAKRDLAKVKNERGQIVENAVEPYEKARTFEVLKVFLLRLALTLPLLLIAAWLIFKKRQSTYWPIYRGFVIFSLFAFFVELVPYLPSYGGYVRYSVGIVLALLFAHFATKGMAHYLQKKKSEESRPESEKRKLIAYETAVKKISNGVCPSCDRQFAAARKLRKGEDKDEIKVDFCVHCGFCLFSACRNCGQRENSFYKYCGACGVASEDAPVVAQES